LGNEEYDFLTKFNDWIAAFLKCDGHDIHIGAGNVKSQGTKIDMDVFQHGVLLRKEAEGVLTKEFHFKD
jgi:uncharacterized protein YukJ